MKLTKKVLAVVMALGLIVCMAAFAFAAEANTYSLDVAKSEDGKVFIATLNAHDYIGLSSGKVVVTYEGLDLDHFSPGVQTEAVKKAEGNNFDYQINMKKAGEIIYGFVFTENLWTAEQFAAAAPEDETLVVDTANFDLASFTFKAKDKAPAYKIVIDVYSKNGDVDNAPFHDEYVVPVEPESTTANPSEPTTGHCCPGNQPCENTTRCCCPGNKPCETTTCNCGTCNCPHAPKTDGGQDTGDNGILAVMAGVIALAGAAVVVTRKRK